MTTTTEHSHGTYSPSSHTYMKMGCRCDECRAAYLDGQARAAAARRGKPRKARDKRRRALLDGADACLWLVGDAYYDDKPDVRRKLAQAAALMREEATKKARQ